ncbi:putative reverse transcriptase zinc-binding domain-containing protein [Helianthus debilis subsp. tardiflorus]
MKQVLFKISNDPVRFIMAWNSWVPKKVDLFMWKTEMNRIPTLVAIRNSNVNMESVVCSLCGEQDESSEHLLISCEFASAVWNYISSWCGVSPIFAFSVWDLLTLHHNSRFGRQKNKVFQGVIMTAGWCIWNMRNDKFYSNKSATFAKVVEDIKSLGYLLQRIEHPPPPPPL